MLRLFNYIDYKITFDPETLTLKPFKVLYDRDKTKDKRNVIMEFAFLYFFCDPRSDFKYLTDEEERMEAVKKAEGFPEDWKPDEDIINAIEFYNSFKTSSAILLEDTRIFIDKVRMWMKECDFTATDDKGKPIYPLNTILSTIKQIPGVLKDLDNAEKSVNKETVTTSKMRGSGEKTILEDGVI